MEKSKPTNFMEFFQKNLQGKKDIWYFLNEESPLITSEGITYLILQQKHL